MMIDFTLPPELEAHDPPEARGTARDGRVTLAGGDPGESFARHFDHAREPELSGQRLSCPPLGRTMERFPPPNPSFQPSPIWVGEVHVARLRCRRLRGRRIGDDAYAAMIGLQPPKHQRCERHVLAQQRTD